MTDEQQLEQQIFELGEEMRPGTDFTSDVMKRIANSTATPAKKSVDVSLARTVWSRVRTFVAIVAVTTLVIWLRQSNDPADVASNDWWLGTPAVYAEEIVHALQQAQVEGVVFRSSTTSVFDDGSEEKNRNVRTIAVVHERYRYESTTTDGRLASVTWSVPDNEEYVVTKYLAFQKSTRVRRVSREEGLGASPIARVLEISRLIDQANRQMAPTDIDGHQCIGFEIAANKVFKRPKSGIYQIWLDTKTKRPVKMIFDRESRMKDDRNIKRAITVSDRFEWNPDLPDNTFEPHETPQPLR